MTNPSEALTWYESQEPPASVAHKNRLDGIRERVDALGGLGPGMCYQLLDELEECHRRIWELQQAREGDS